MPMKPSNPFLPRAAAVLLPILILGICWLASRSNDDSFAAEPRAATAENARSKEEPSRAEPHVCDGNCHTSKAASEIGQPQPLTSHAEEERRAAAGAGQPLPPDFLDQVVQGERIGFDLPDGTAVVGKVQHLERDAQGILVVSARTQSPHPGQLLIQRQTSPGVMGPFVGHVLFDDRDTGWKIEPVADRTAAHFVPRPNGAILCVGLTLPPEEPDPTGDPQQAPQDHPDDIPIPPHQPIIPLQSLPGATGVIYLDFDGEEGPFPGWASGEDFDAEPANASNAQIFEIWQRVSEDYQGFNLNITTDRTVFDNAPAGRRQQIIVTPTNTAQPGAGGVAFVDSYNWDNPRVCWAFIQKGKSAAEVVSHEIGHTLGLEHHGRTSPQEEYYRGHGSGDVGWAPIMGSSYNKHLSQWSRGEYLNANRSSQDDLAKIAGNNDVAYRADDYGDVLASSGYLEIFADDSVDSEGIIERTGDIDAFRFETSGGPIDLSIQPVTNGPNLDIHAEIVEADTLALVLEHNPLDQLDATLNVTLAAGEYLLRVRGTGRGDPLGDGYTDYASLGTYLISGAVQGAVIPERFTVAEHSPNGTAIGSIQPRNDHAGAALSYTITSGNTDGAFSLDPTSGMLSVADTSVLDYETLSTRWDDPAVITPFVSITNPDNPALNEPLRVVVTITDINEPPSITVTGTSFAMAERAEPGTELTTASGSDPDRFQLVTFSITGGNADGAFQIDPDTGVLSVAQTLDVADTLTRQLTLTATDTHQPPLATSVSIDVTVVDHSSPAAPGGIYRTFYENISGNAVVNLTSAAKFPDDPDLEIPLSAFDGGTHGDLYGSTLRGYLVAPATGDYQFRIASDDGGSLLFAADGNPASATEIASVSGSTARYQWDAAASQLSPVFSLQQGQLCYIEARHKEATGGDHVAVAWTGPGITTPQVIPGKFLIPFYQNYPPKIPIATLSIRENAFPGQAVGFAIPTDANLEESFTQFEIIGGTGQQLFAIDSGTGRITVAAPLDNPPSPLTLDLRVTDGGTPPLSGEGSISIELTPADAFASDAITQQIWSDLNGGSIADLTGVPTYPHSPSYTRELTNGFDSGTNLGNNYGSRIRALVTPPTSGEYTFYISTDDNGQLLLGDDASPANASVIAEVTNWAGPGNWTKFASQTSDPVQLTAGQSYYIEALHKEGSGGDHVQVAWTGPGIASPTIIPVSALAPYNLNAPPEFSPSSYAFVLDASQPLGTEIGTLSASDPEGEAVVLAITSGNETGHFALDANGHLTFASADFLFNGITELTVTAQDAGLEGAFPLATATATVTIDVSNAEDLDGPVPDPMGWSSPPAAISSTEISMTATAAYGQGGVEYFFECLMPDGNSSGWQASPTYTDTGLTPGSTYAYRVKAREKAASARETGWSPHEAATLPTRPVITGGEVAIVDGYIIRTFRTGGDEQFTLQGSGGSVEVDVLVVGGGGGGGSSTQFGTAGAGGGGAGGVLYREGLMITQSTPVNVGYGGFGGRRGNTPGLNGGNSSFGDLVALGGGGGAGGNVAGKDGGSGGGGRGNPGGAGLQPSASTAGFGNDGAEWPSGGGDGAGGGGGAGSPAPAPDPASVGGPGGAGLAFDISGTLRYYAGGGGGGGANDAAFGAGGIGGGGNGGNDNASPTSGVAHTGGGGGGGNDDRTGASGGSGIVIVRYPVDEPDDFQNWASQWPAINLGGRDADFNGDGMTNDEKRIWGLDPTDASDLRPILTLPHPDSLSFSYTRRQSSLTGRVFSVWVTTDLLNWEREDAAVQTAAAPDANGVEVVTVTLPTNIASERLFVQVRAE